MKKMKLLSIGNNGEEVKKKTGWMIINSKINDMENFNKNVEILRTLSHHNWCTSNFYAAPYLAKGDLHIYCEKDKPKIIVRFVGDEIVEIQGEKNNHQIPNEYLNIIKSHIQDFNISQDMEIELAITEKNIKLKELSKKLGKPFSKATSEDFFYAFGLLEKRDDDGLLILKGYNNPYNDFEWEMIGTNENNLFKDVKEIKGDARFTGSSLSNLGMLRKIGGNAIFTKSKIVNLGQLEEIGNDIYLENSLLNESDFAHIKIGTRCSENMFCRIIKYFKNFFNKSCISLMKKGILH